MADNAIPLVYNPVAGRGSASRRISDVIDKLAQEGVIVRPLASTASGDVEAKIRQLSDDGESRVLVAGGDGSVHEAVNGLMQSQSPAALGLLPLGTGNDFAKANGIPLQPQLAITELASRLRSQAPARAIDVGVCNARYFANGAGIGFDAVISRIAASIRWPIGQLVYPIAVIRGVADGVVTPRLELEFDEDRLDAPLTLANFSIGPWLGGMFPIAPPAKNDDGMIDLVYADALTRFQVIRLLPKLLRGTHLAAPSIHHRLIKACRVRAEAALPAHLDGENQPLQQDFDIRVLPAALRLL